MNQQTDELNQKNKESTTYGKTRVCTIKHQEKVTFDPETCILAMSVPRIHLNEKFLPKSGRAPSFSLKSVVLPQPRKVPKIRNGETSAFRTRCSRIGFRKADPLTAKQISSRARTRVLSGDAAADGWRWREERGSMMTKEERERSQFYEWGLKSWEGRGGEEGWIHCIKDQLGYSYA